MMLVGFSVGNFKSFDVVQSISFLPSKIIRHKEHIANLGNHRVLKSGLIFGANASGKSNLIQAVSFSRNIIVRGLDKVDLSKKYFRIRNQNYNKPGIFEYHIIVNEKAYIYGIEISYSKQEIISEWLCRLEDKSKKKVYLFKRNVDESGISNVETDIKRISKDVSERVSVYFEDFSNNISDTLRKKTMLSDIAMRGNDKTGILKEIFDVCNWFEKFLVIFPDSKYVLLNELGTNENERQFFQNVMNYLDTGIETIENQSQEMDFDKLFKDMPEEIVEKYKIKFYSNTVGEFVTVRLRDQIVSLHKDENGNLVYNKLFLGHGNKNDKFEYNDESDGTKRLFDLIPLLYNKRENLVIFIDEIDRSFHTKLSKKFLDLFYEKNEEEQGQLIATTHDAYLLDQDLIRQDEIWFVERQQDHSSKIFSLSGFKERFDKKIDKEYLLGRYGAVPIFGKNIRKKN